VGVTLRFVKLKSYKIIVQLFKVKLFKVKVRFSLTRVNLKFNNQTCKKLLMLNAGSIIIIISKKLLYI